MKERGSFLSERLRMLAGMVTPGNRVADIGCDHGFLSIYLVRKGLCPGAVGMDLREGPLAAARAHVEEYGLGEYIELRLSDGLAEYVPGEADTMICAGMGGRLMEGILTRGMEKAREMKELILQPQSELPSFRRFLRNAGFEIVQEEALREGGKYYFAMKARYAGECRKEAQNAACESAGGIGDPERSGNRQETWSAVCEGAGGIGEPKRSVEPKRSGGPEGNQEPEELQELYDTYGRLLLTDRHPVLEEYLRRQESALKSLAAALEAGEGGTVSEKARIRRRQVMKELERNQKALLYYSEAYGAGDYLSPRGSRD